MQDELTILVADADASFRSFLSGLLRPRNLKVIEARGVWDVWPALEKHAVDLFVVAVRVHHREVAVGVQGELDGQGERGPHILVQVRGEQGALVGHVVSGAEHSDWGRGGPDDIR